MLVAFKSNWEPVICKLVAGDALPLVLNVTPLYVNASVNVNVSILAVPSMNKSFHSLVVEPISCLSSAAGINEDEISASDLVEYHEKYHEVNK